jgi:hypothetical protein
LLSDYEGLPIALQEAMACGLVPVCLNEESGLNELIKHGENGFIVNDREEDYFLHLSKLTDNRELWKKLSIASRKTIETHYNIEQSYEKWLSLLNHISINNTKTIRVPFRIRIKDISRLPYGDDRKPSQYRKIKEQWKVIWTRLRLTFRPRARIKSILKKQ